VAVKEVHLAFDLGGFHEVIRGGPGPELAAGEFERVAERLGQFLVGLSEDSDARVAGVFAEDGVVLSVEPSLLMMSSTWG